MRMPGPAETTEGRGIDISSDQFDALRKLSIALDPRGVQGNSIDFEVHIPEVATNEPGGTEPVLRSITAGWVRQNKVQALKITEATCVPDASSRQTEYSFMSKAGKIIFAGYKQKVHTTDGSEYEVKRKFESNRDLPGLVGALMHFSEVSSQIDAVNS